MASKVEVRAADMQELAGKFAALMEQNEKLAEAIEACEASKHDEDEFQATMEQVVELHTDFNRQAGCFIAHLTVVTASIDNSSPAMLLGTLAGLMVEGEIQHCPELLLSALFGGGR